MTTQATGVAAVIMTSTGVQSFFSKLASAVSGLPAEALKDFGDLLKEGESQLTSTLAVLAPGLDDDVTALDTAVTTAADAFVIAHTGPLVAGVVDPEIKVFVDAAASTAKAKIDAWAAKYTAATPAPVVAS